MFARVQPPCFSGFVGWSQYPDDGALSNRPGAHGCELVHVLFCGWENLRHLPNFREETALFIVFAVRGRGFGFRILAFVHYRP